MLLLLAHFWIPPFRSRWRSWSPTMLKMAAVDKELLWFGWTNLFKRIWREARAQENVLRLLRHLRWPKASPFMGRRGNKVGKLDMYSVRVHPRTAPTLTTGRGRVKRTCPSVKWLFLPCVEIRGCVWRMCPWINLCGYEHAENTDVYNIRVSIFISTIMMTTTTKPFVPSIWG